MLKNLTPSVLAMLLLGGLTVMASDIPVVKIKIVKAKKATGFDKFRKILVSPTVNTPEPFQGFGGFCGWPKVRRLSNGDLYVTFSAGYWHASWPAPFEKYGQPKQYAEDLYRQYPWMETWDCPTGGQMMWIRSRDNGQTWSRPKTFPIVPGAYEIGAIRQFSDGTMYAAAIIQLGYGWRGKMPPTSLEFARTGVKLWSMRSDWTVVFRSDDNGDTWREVTRFEGPFQFMASPQSLFEAPDGALLMLTEGVPWPQAKGWPKANWITTLLRSEDQGATWQALSVIGNNAFSVEEGSAAFLPDGSIGFASRPTSAWFQSYDGGVTWSEPRQLHEGSGRLFKKGDQVITPDGVNAILTCSGPGGNGQVLYSRDSGQTWIKPAMDRGFRYDPLGYYPSGCVLEDGSIFAVGDSQGFKNKYGPYGARVTAMRFRIKTPAEGEGIELLPIGGEPAAPGTDRQRVNPDAADEADRTLEGK